jgi:hypothetical protein
MSPFHAQWLASNRETPASRRTGFVADAARAVAGRPDIGSANAARANASSGGKSSGISSSAWVNM